MIVLGACRVKSKLTCGFRGNLVDGKGGGSGVGRRGEERGRLGPRGGGEGETKHVGMRSPLDKQSDGLI